jgi:hypothetical protein
MREVWLLCEGKEGSLDEQVINALVIQPSGLDTRLVPAGGDSSLPLAKQLLPQIAIPRTPSGRLRERRILTVRDRNFEALSKVEASWNDIACSELIWRRHEIENYLLHPLAVYRAVNALRLGNPPFAQADDARVLLIEIGRSLAAHHAGILLAEKYGLECKTRLDRQDFSIPKQWRKLSVSASGTEAQRRWVTEIRRALSQFRNNYHRCGRVRAVPSVEVRRRYDEELRKFMAEEYLDDLRFLEEFEGKALLARLRERLRSDFRLGPTEETLTTELLKQLKVGYISGDIQFGPDEFAGLQDRLRRAATG